MLYSLVSHRGHFSCYRLCARHLHLQRCWPSSLSRSLPSLRWSVGPLAMCQAMLGQLRLTSLVVRMGLSLSWSPTLVLSVLVGLLCTGVRTRLAFTETIFLRARTKLNVMFKSKSLVKPKHHSKRRHSKRRTSPVVSMFFGGVRERFGSSEAIFPTAGAPVDDPLPFSI